MLFRSELFATHIGGAATLEGVMMRGRDHWAVAVRCEDGSIYTCLLYTSGHGVAQNETHDSALNDGAIEHAVAKEVFHLGKTDYQASKQSLYEHYRSHPFRTESARARTSRGLLK